MEQNGTLSQGLQNGAFTGIESADEMWRAYKATGNTDEGLRNQLMLRYQKCIKPIAEKIHFRVPPEVELDDLMSAGLFGLMDAIDAFELERQVKFETYCQPRIRGAILDELRYMDWVPRLVRYRTAKFNEVKNRFKAIRGRDPTPEELQTNLGLNSEEFGMLLPDSVAVATRSATRIKVKGRQNSPDETFGLESLLIDQQLESPTLGMTQEDLGNFITRGLGSTARLIVKLYHFEGYNMKEIGEMLFMSESRVSQLHSGAIEQIRSNELIKEHFESHLKR